MCFGYADRIALIEKMPKVNKRNRLTFQEKYELVQEVKAGASKQYILHKYGIGETMYRKVLSREDDLNNKFQSNEYQKKKSLKTNTDVLLDAAVFEWFKQTRDRGAPITGSIIREKARILGEKLNAPHSFKASNGWLHGFQRRYGIRLKEEILSGAVEFSPILKTKIESENLKLDNIYNADESGILWRLLMACTVPLHLEEKEALEREECKYRVTSLFCANASGSHRIPLLLIGESETPTCLNNLITKNSEDRRLKNLESLGVIYTHQASAWMDQCIFLLWYKDEFIPRVLERQRKDGITGKVVLLLDNAPSHPSLDELNAINENFEVLYLPPKVTALIQPMAKGLIASTKKLFKKELLRRLLLSKKSEGAAQFLKELDLPDFFGMLSLAWNALESSTLQKAWKPLLSNSLVALQKTNVNLGGEKDPLSIDNAVLSEPESPIVLITFPYEICDELSKLLSGPDYPTKKSREYLLNWFEKDDVNSDCGWELSSDSDILNLVTTRRRELEIRTKIKNRKTRFENSNIVNFVACGNLEPEIVPEIENSETVVDNPEPMEVTSSEAFGYLMRFKTWAKSRADCLPKYLDYIRELENWTTEPKVYSWT